MKQELTYWITLSLIPNLWTRRKNEIYVNCFKHEPQISIIELFEDSGTWDIVGLTEAEKVLFEEARKQLANNSFLIEELIAQGYDIIPITHEEYPQTLKKNLKQGAPTVIYTKGNKKLLQEPSIAIVGSRKADSKSLTFTDNVSRKGVAANKVIVSGFAKGVDRQALDSALEVDGKSIIVLPQGITTFSTGFKQYFKHIANGSVLVMSTFAPKAPWSVELAMARNPIIYGMASEIYVAQSDEKGGTWSGVIDGLKKERTIYVRYPDKGETNANLLLIEKGAKAVDINGEISSLNCDCSKAEDEESKNQLDAEITRLLDSVDMISAKEIISRLRLDLTDIKLKQLLEKMPGVEKLKVKNRIYFRLKGKTEQVLF